MIGTVGQLDRLLSASADARRQAEAAFDRSRRLLAEANRLKAQAQQSCRASRPHRRYAHVVVVVDGHMAEAVVRTDGTVLADRVLLERARCVVAMGDTFDDGRIPATMGADPLSSTLTLLRASDQVLRFDMAVDPPLH